jgi:asparagine synthetase B (glutamine-hydrolysing)
LSAFYDIYIGYKPEYHRLENGNWKQEGNYWASKPVKSTFVFFDEAANETHHLVVLGQFYETIDKQVLLRQCAAYCDGTSKQFADPAGHYILFLLDKRNNQRHVFTNRFGTYHAYYSVSPKAISTYYLGMAKQSAEKKMDWQGINGFFEMGYFPADTTYLDSIKIFEPASHYCFDAELNLVSRKRYWNWTYDTTKYATDSIDRLHEALEVSLNCALNGKRVALPISGGLDSRTIAGVLSGGRHNYNSLWSFSYGFTGSSKETKIARQIAKACNLPFDQYIVPNYLFDKIELITDAVELFQYIDGTRQACMKEQLEQNSDVVVGGHWGDVWLDDMKMPQMTNEEAVKTAFSKKIIKKGSQWLSANVSGGHLNGDVPSAYTYFKEFTERYKYIDDADFVMKIYKTDQWSFRWTTASVRMYQAGAMPVLPFYDRRVVDIFLSIPSCIVKNRALQVKYIKKYFPKLAKIKWQEYDSNLYNYKWINNRNLLYRGVNKIKRTLTPERQIIRNADVFYLNDDGKKQLYTALLNKTLTEVVAKEKIEKLLTVYFANPSAANTYAVSMLHTFAQFLYKLNV